MPIKPEFVSVLSPLSEEHQPLVKYPRRTTEFEIQAWLFVKLLEVGFDVRGEAAINLPAGERCFFDLLVFEEEQLKCIIEIKTMRAKGKSGEHEKRQRQHYRRFGVPVFYVYGMIGALEVRDELLRTRARDLTLKSHGKVLYTPVYPDDGELVEAWRQRDKDH
ncbi:hypothetical protein K2O51_23245 [Cupriavidus pinatubonensis]|uniref:hypothetical protein n=1 Tax=Cupriavidus pinatubonensis TaxID=248026 RepID=UPI001C72FD81|nr:hypothetical protein [Cupriavidus pinatubonensis]QYY30288.1 hypothetical protein K2O51_23245 [Cupriavidus pinatubonensis]